MAQLMLINPAKRPSKRRKTTARKARRNPAAPVAKANPARRRRLRVSAAPARRRRVRRNPIGATGIMGSLMNAAQGAGGALAVNAVANLLPLPIAMKTGLGGTATKMGLAVALGMVAKPVLGRAAGKMAEGAMTVAAFEALRDMLPVSMGGGAVTGSVAGLGFMSPGMNAGGYARPNMSLPTPEFSGVGEYVSGMGEYVYN